VVWHVRDEFRAFLGGGIECQVLEAFSRESGDAQARENRQPLQSRPRQPPGMPFKPNIGDEMGNLPICGSVCGICLQWPGRTNQVVSRLVQRLGQVDAGLVLLGLGMDEQTEPGEIAAGSQADGQSWEEIQDPKREAVVADSAIRAHERRAE